MNVCFFFFFLVCHKWIRIIFFFAIMSRILKSAIKPAKWWIKRKKGNIANQKKSNDECMNFFFLFSFHFFSLYFILLSSRSLLVFFIFSLFACTRIFFFSFESWPWMCSKRKWILKVFDLLAMRFICIISVLVLDCCSWYPSMN